MDSTETSDTPAKFELPVSEGHLLHALQLLEKRDPREIVAEDADCGRLKEAFGEFARTEHFMLIPRVYSRHFEFINGKSCDSAFREGIVRALFTCADNNDAGSMRGILDILGELKLPRRLKNRLRSPIVLLAANLAKGGDTGFAEELSRMEWLLKNTRHGLSRMVERFSLEEPAERLPPPASSTGTGGGRVTRPFRLRYRNRDSRSGRRNGRRQPVPNQTPIGGKPNA